MKKHQFHFGDKVVVKLFSFNVKTQVLRIDKDGNSTSVMQPHVFKAVGILKFRYPKSVMWTIELENGDMIDATESDMIPIPHNASPVQIQAMMNLA